MNKELNLLGMATRAKKITNGETLTLEAVKNRQVKLIYLGKDAGQNTKKRVLDKAKTNDIPVINQYTIEELSHHTGAFNRVVIGVIDKGFKNKLTELNEKGT